MKNYFKLAVRNLLRNKEYFFINVFGLAIGMACAIMVLLYIREQSKYDDFHPASDRLYRVYLDSKIGGLESSVALTSPMFAFGLKPYVPEIEQACRVFRIERDIQVSAPVTTILGNKSLIYVDSTFFDLFGFKLLQGDPKTCLNQPRSILLSKTLANQLFPKGAIGKVLTVEHEKKWTVTGIVEDCPVNSHLYYESIVSITSLIIPKLDWTSFNMYNYFRLKEDADLSEGSGTIRPGLSAVEDKMLKGYIAEAGEDIEKTMGKTINQLNQKDEYFVLRLQKVTSIHLFSHLKYEFSQNVNFQTILIIAGISILIILIAGINYANLSTARLAGRVREIGIRKIIGSQPRELSFYLLTESVTISFISLFFALVLVELIYPNAATILMPDPQQSIQFLLFRLSPFIFSVTLLIGLFAGVYPAFYIVRFSPAAILRQQKQFSVGSKGIRGLLVIVQFLFSLVIIYSTSTIYRQLRYIQNKGVGFEQDRVMVIQNLPRKTVEWSTFRQKLLELKSVENVSFTSSVPGKPVGMESFQNGTDRSNNLLMYVMEADSSLLETYGMKLVEGSIARNSHSSLDTIDVIVNEEVVSHLGLKNPLGSKIYRVLNDSTTNCLIIRGVVGNFNFESLHSPIQPLIIFPGREDHARYINIRLSRDNREEANQEINQLWKSEFPDLQMVQYSISKSFNDFYLEEQLTGQIALVFSFFAIFIACMGLYSLLALTTVYRTKEIGIRKVLGAGTIELVILLTREILKLILTAGIIALPIAFLLSYYWLDRFAYHVDLSFTNYLFVFIAVLAVAVFTIYRQLWHTINSDSGDSLRFE